MSRDVSASRARPDPNRTQGTRAGAASSPVKPRNDSSSPSRADSPTHPFDPFDDRFAALSPTLASQDSLLAELLAADAREHEAVFAATDEPAGSPGRQTIPLYRVFARDAEPLVLPGLDDAIRALGGPASFSPMPTSNGSLSDRVGDLMRRDSHDSMTSLCVKGDDAEADAGKEQRAWDAWVRDGPPWTRWSRFMAALRRRVARKHTETKRDDGRPNDTVLSPEQYRRSLIFPPFHRLPPGITVTDLKQNRRRSQPLLTLQSALGIVGNAILGAAGSNKGISLTTVEGIRDLMQ